MHIVMFVAICTLLMVIRYIYIYTQHMHSPTIDTLYIHMQRVSMLLQTYLGPMINTINTGYIWIHILIFNWLVSFLHRPAGSPQAWEESRVYVHIIHCGQQIKFYLQWLSFRFSNAPFCKPFLQADIQSEQEPLPLSNIYILDNVRCPNIFEH